MACFRGFAYRGGKAAAWRRHGSVRKGCFYSEGGRGARLSFSAGDAEGAVLEGRYEAAVLPLAVTKTKADYDFQAAGDTVLCTVTLSVEGNPAGRQGRIAFCGTENGVGEHFSASIKEEVEHTIKTALSEGVDFLGILPRAERALPQLAKACTREQLWERMAFRVVAKGADYGYGAQALIKIWKTWKSCI